jgi:hypothetical protein
MPVAKRALASVEPIQGFSHWRTESLPHRSNCMRYFSPFWAMAALTLMACGGGTSEASLAAPSTMASTQVRLEERFVRSASAVPVEWLEERLLPVQVPVP